MRKVFVLLLLCTCAIKLHAQAVYPDSVFVSYNDSLHLWQEKYLSLDGRLYSLKFYSDSSLTIQENKELYYFSNGRIKSVATYKNNKLNDTITSFYSDGKIRRRDVYEDGKYVAGECWGTNGFKIPHTEYKKESLYPGGLSALYTIISINSQQIVLPENEKISGLVQVKLVLDKKGKVINKKIVTSLHPIYDSEVLRICEHLSKFEPEERDGEPVVGSYILSLKF